MLHNKKAVVGETITWIIATIVIIVILVFSVFIVSWFKDNKEFESEQHRDLVLVKSISGYLLTEDESGEKVFEQIFNEGDLNDFNGPLGKKIFEGYERIFLKLGPYSPDWLVQIVGSVREGYFNEPPSASPISEEFILDENKYIIFETGV